MTGGEIKHFLSINNLSIGVINSILDRADSFFPIGSKSVKKIPILRGKTIANLFFEPSTRTKTTFELAATRLSADTLNINIESSATKKGESLSDTLKTLASLKTDIFVVRHNQSGASAFIANLMGDQVSVINAGDGRHEHPTQALLDLFTIKRNKGNFSKLQIAIIGDILHSRVARSEISALQKVGVKDIRVVGPRTLIPSNIEHMGVKAFYNLEQGIKNSDVIITLRLQKERMKSALLPSASEYFETFGLTEAKLSHAKSDAIVMHPGPINRGVEIDSAVADGSSSRILEQASNGIAIRMAIMAMLSGERM